MSRKGFTLIELMVTVVIVGILAGIAVPKLFGHTAKAKAAEITPAAFTYIKLQQAFFLEHKGVGSWNKIGYAPPGGGETKNFRYTRGDITSSVRPSYVGASFGGQGLVGWQAESLVGLNQCLLGNKWVVRLIFSGSGMEYKTQLLSSESAPSCLIMTGPDWAIYSVSD